MRPLPHTLAPASLQMLSHQGVSQFSTRNPGTRENSRRLLVTSIAPRLMACPAMSMSSGPISLPARDVRTQVTLARRHHPSRDDADRLHGAPGSTGAAPASAPDPFPRHPRAECENARAGRPASVCIRAHQAQSPNTGKCRGDRGGGRGRHPGCGCARPGQRWADLLRRVYDIDMRTCPSCGSSRRQPQFANFLKDAPKFGLGREAHGSIRVQEGQPDLRFDRIDTVARPMVSGDRRDSR